MRRAASRSLVVLSPVLLAAAVVFWSRSYRFPENRPGESFSLTRSDPLWWVISHRGTLTLCRQNGKDWGEDFGDIRFLGFGFGGLSGPKGSLWNLAVPYWFVAAALLAPSALWATGAWRRRGADRRGLCPACGSDLRATPGRCPECGAVPAPVAAR